MEYSPGKAAWLLISCALWLGACSSGDPQGESLGSRSDPVVGPPPLAEVGVWELATTSGPSARFGHAMVYDNNRNLTVLYGGDDGANLRGDIWEWNGTSWAQKCTGISCFAFGPAARRYHTMGMTQDGAVVFGGDTGGTNSAETWTWDGTGWTQQTPLTSPFNREGAMTASFAYPFTRGIVMVSGGSGGSEGYDWQWYDSNWFKVTCATCGGQLALDQAAMAFDSVHNQIVQFGGFGVSQSCGLGCFTDTFSSGQTNTWLPFGTAGWTVAATTGPDARDRHAMAFDAVRGRTVMFGGEYSDGAVLSTTWAPVANDTWEWDGSSWRKMTATGPTPRFAHAMAYDAARKRVVLFGGNDGHCTQNFLGTVCTSGGVVAAETWLYHVRGGNCSADTQFTGYS